MIAPIFVFILSEIGLYWAFYSHRFLLEQITARAKLEQILSLSKEGAFALEDDAYWKNEAVIPTRYLNDRYKYKSSSDWIAARADQKLTWGIYRLFRSFQMIALIMAAALAYSALA